MSFFDRIAEPDQVADDPDGSEPGWDPPEWVKGPPLGVAGGVVPFRRKLYGDDRLVVWVDRVVVYPTGLMISLELFLAGDGLDGRRLAGRFPWALTDRDARAEPMEPWAQPASVEDYFRFGVRYGDGRLVATSTWDQLDATHERLIEMTEPPESLVLQPRSGSANSAHAAVGLWVWPEPPPGPVDLVLEWPAASVAETMTSIPDDSIAEGRRDISHPW